VFGENAAPPRTWPFHVLLSVPLESDEIERIGERQGWRAKTFGRGMQGQKPLFHVIEFWLENRLMIEVVSPAMAREYERFLKNAQLSAMSDPESLRLMRATHVSPRQPSRIRSQGSNQEFDQSNGALIGLE